MASVHDQEQAQQPVDSATRSEQASTAWPNYRDMTAEQMLAWGKAESAARQADLAEAKSAAALLEAQERAVQRRKAIGASRSVAAAMVIDAIRA